MKKNKGFTLIELLAVIIVLAIIMVLTIPNVLTTMNTSKKKSLVVFAKKALVQAEKFAAEKEMNGEAIPTTEQDLSAIGMSDTGTYSGTVTISAPNANGERTYTATITDGTYHICSESLDSIEQSGHGAKTSCTNS